MTKILYIAASPRGAMSQSGKLAEAYLAARQAAQPEIRIDRLDLWRADLPEFDGDKAAAKMTFFGVGDMDAPRQSAWDQVVTVTNRFIEADEYVLSVPMWNGGIPYKLKQYIDIITQPGLLFGFDPGVYAPGAHAKYGTDHHSTYLDWWLDFIGVAKIETVRFQPSLLTADPAGDQMKALDRARDLHLRQA